MSGRILIGKGHPSREWDMGDRIDDCRCSLQPATARSSGGQSLLTMAKHCVTSLMLFC